MIEKGLLKKKSALIVQPTLVHYRKSLFIRLTASERVNIKIVGGSDNDSIRGIETESSSNIRACLINSKIKIGSHTFIWQKGLFKLIKKYKPDIVVLTGVDLHLISSLVLALLKKVYNVKVIWWGHATINKQGKWGQKLRKFFFNRGDGIMTYSDENNNNLRKIIDKQIPIKTVKNCINDDEYGFNQKLVRREKFSSNRFTILFSGRLTSEKRVDILIKAIKIICERNIAVRCVVIGSGKELNNSIKLADSLQINTDIEFIGEKYKSDCVPYFNRADLFVLPGKVGLSIIHGLSYGLPVITSDKKEIHSPEYEIITKGENGDFFVEFDAESLADKIIFWKNRIELCGSSIKDTCVKSVIENGYTPEIMSHKMLDFFCRV